MIPAFLLRFVGGFVNPEFQRRAAVAIMVLAFAVLVAMAGLTWLKLHNRAVIKQDRAASNVKAAQASKAATEKAWWQLSIDQAENTERTEQLRKDIANETDSGLAGNRTRAVIRGVRDNQN